MFILTSYRTCHTSNPDTVTQLFNHSTDVAKGMHYLSDKGFVHRDLAARNILVTGGKTCKVSTRKELLVAMCALTWQCYSKEVY